MPRGPPGQGDPSIRRWVGAEPPAATQTVVSHGSVESYHSSPGELVWLDGKRRGSICATAESEAVEGEAKRWLDYIARAWKPEGRAAPEPTEEERAALSSFRVANETHFIEPLHGIARHPFAQVGCRNSEEHRHDVNIFDIRYFALHNDCGNQQQGGLPKPRTVLFDLGASVGFNGVPGGLYPEMPDEGGGLAPSVPLFWRLYEDRCLEPDEVHAWETSPRFQEPYDEATAAKYDTTTSKSDRHTFDQRLFFGELPDDLKPKVHFYHERVDELFLDLLQRVVKPEDFVAVKVDIDQPGLETPMELIIMQALADRPELAALVDEIFFEYHFHFDGMGFGWSTVPPGADVDSAIGLMHRMRALGVRSHFWI